LYGHAHDLDAAHQGPTRQIVDLRHCPRLPIENAVLVEVHRIGEFGHRHALARMDEDPPAERGLPVAVLDVLPRVKDEPCPGLPDAESLHPSPPISRSHSTSGSVARTRSRIPCRVSPWCVERTHMGTPNRSSRSAKMYRKSMLSTPRSCWRC